MVQEDRRPSPPEQPRQRHLAAGRRSRSSPADDEVDALEGVVDRHRELVGPVAGAVADEQVTALRGRRLHLRSEPGVVERLDVAVEPDAQAEAVCRRRGLRRGTCPGSAARRRLPPASRDLPARAAAGVDEPLAPRARAGPCGTRRRGRSGAARLTSGARPSHARSSRIAASYSGRERSRSWSSMRSSTRPPSARARPHTKTALTTWPRWSRPVGRRREARQRRGRQPRREARRDRRRTWP